MIMWKYEKEVFQSKEELLKYLLEQIDITEHFSNELHMIVNEDNKIVALNVGGKYGEMYLTTIVERMSK